MLAVFQVFKFVCLCWGFMGPVNPMGSVEVSQSSQPNGVMSSMVNLPNHTFTEQAWSSKRLTSIVFILLSEKVVQITNNIHNFNPFTLSGLFYQKALDWSISNSKVSG